MFDVTVCAVMSYDVEIWRWGERKRMKRMQERYARWFLGVDWETPGYIERKELKRNKLGLRVVKMA